VPINLASIYELPGQCFEWLIPEVQMIVAATRENRRTLSVQARQKRRHGVAAVELAVLLPLLGFLFVIALDYSRIFYFTMVVTNCARSGAIYGSQNPTNANDTSGISSNALMDAANMDPSSLTVTSATDSSTNPTYVDVTVSYTFNTLTNYPGVPSTTNITRTVRMLVTPWTPNN
jgi:Flp pilus assembly protein TadG